MGTNIRPEIDKENSYYISKHRYYELLHFCKQYSEWKKERGEIYSSQIRPFINSEVKAQADTSSVEKAALKLSIIDDKIQIFENTLAKVDPLLKIHIFQAVTVGTSYDKMRAKADAYDYYICSKNEFYKEYRRFFWMLDQERR